jgi:hypothetical protein
LILTIIITMVSAQYIFFHISQAQSQTNLNNDQTNSMNQNSSSTTGSAGPILYPFFSDKFTLNDNNNWLILKGNWSYSLNGLQGGIDGKINSPDNNLLLSPAASNNQSIISASFRINNLDNNVSNYVSIVNSFKDIKNYQQAGINIYNGKVYVLFSNIVNGKLINNPAWPGLKTDLKWKPGTDYIMSVFNKGNSQDLIINGTKFASRSDNTVDNNGYTGLNYGRVKDIVFNVFEVQNNGVSLNK